MFTHNRLLEETARDHVNTLLREAEHMRLVRRCKPEHTTRLSHLLFHTGGWLVRCGDWLQRRYTVPSSMQPNLG
jgi:hypothetical protein